MEEDIHIDQDILVALSAIDERMASPVPIDIAEGLALVALRRGEVYLNKLDDLLRDLDCLRLRVAEGSALDGDIAHRQKNTRSKRQIVYDALKALWRIHLAVSSPDFLSPLLEPTTKPTRPPKTESRSARIRDRLAEILSERGPTHRSDLLARLVADGLVGNEAKPMNRLASILTESKHMFGSQGGGVYFLRKVEPNGQPVRTTRAPLSAAPEGAAASQQP